MIYALMLFQKNNPKAFRKADGKKRAGKPNSSHQIPFCLTPTQLTALSALLNSLTAKAKKDECEEALHSVFYSLYMDDQPLAIALQTFASPVAAFFALRCWNNTDGSFINVRDIPVALAKLQYSIRLRCSHKLLVSLKENDMELGGDWMG